MCIFNRFKFSTVLRVHKIHLRKYSAFVNRRNINYAKSLTAKITEAKNWTLAGLFYSIHYAPSNIHLFVFFFTKGSY